MAGFMLSFSDGRCRLSFGHTLDEAITDAYNAAEATHTPCKVLDADTYKVLGSVSPPQGMATNMYWRAS